MKLSIGAAYNIQRTITDIDAVKIKSDAVKTGKSWLFPDEDLSEIMAKMRAKNKKGPLWHSLIR